MKSLPRILTVWISGSLALTTWAGANLEGKVDLPPGKAGPAVVARYQSKTTGTVGTFPGPAAVVYLEGPALTAGGTNIAGKVEVGQKNLQFLPGLLPVQKGTRVEFPNHDDEYHNVLSFSKAKEFDLGRYRNTEAAPSVLFDKPGVVQLSCEIHEHMHATVLVLDTPFFTKTDATGNYQLGNVPPGQYTVKVWANGKVVWQKPVELKESENLKLDFPPKD